MRSYFLLSFDLHACPLLFRMWHASDIYNKDPRRHKQRGYVKSHRQDFHNTCFLWLRFLGYIIIHYVLRKVKSFLRFLVCKLKCFFVYKQICLHIDLYSCQQVGIIHSSSECISWYSFFISMPKERIGVAIGAQMF